MEKPQMNLTEDQWIQWMDELAENDYVLVDDFISQEMFTFIMDFFQEREKNDLLKKAGIGSSGELKIYTGENDTLVEPIAKRLLLFKSDIVEHEVLTTNVPRYSLTGWLLHQPATVGYLFR